MNFGNKKSKVANPDEHRADSFLRLMPHGVDLRNVLVAELARSFGFAFKYRGAESLGDFRYSLRPRHRSHARRPQPLRVLIFCDTEQMLFAANKQLIIDCRGRRIDGFVHIVRRDDLKRFALFYHDGGSRPSCEINMVSGGDW